MKTRFALALLIPAFSLHLGAAAAQPIIDEASITLDAAVKAANACEALAKSKGWKVTIWIADDNDVPVYIKHMDGALIEGIHTAELKTKSVKVWLSTSDPAAPDSRIGRSIKTTEGQIMNILLGAFPNTGGVPLFDGGKYIGAMGVGGAGAGDGTCAQAGADAIMKRVGTP